MAPILFPLLKTRNNITQKRGVGPNLPGFRLKAPPVISLSGVTRDAFGVAIPAREVRLIRMPDYLFIDITTSDGSGRFSFNTLGLGLQYRLLGYLSGSPDTAATSVNTLTGAGV